MTDQSVLDPINHRYQKMKQRDSQRDIRIALLWKVREGKLHELFPQFMSSALQGSIVANKIDTAARDLAEVIAPLPALNCASGKMITDSDKRRAGVKNRIGFNYWRESHLDTQMLSGPDWYLSAGHLLGYVEVDWKRRTPIILLENSKGSYFDTDRYGNVLRAAQVFTATIADLVALWGDDLAIRAKLMYDQYGQERNGNSETEFIRYGDDTHVTLFCPNEGCVLASFEHKLGRAPFEVAVRPGAIAGRGQYDDVITPLVAKAMMAQYALSAADKAVNAPIALPDDVVELNVGEDAIIQTNNPQGVQRVNLQVPSSAFAMAATLDSELSDGMRYPDMRSGQSSASVITGRGVQAMMGTFDTQIKTAQTVLGSLLRRLTEMCFEMDEIHFGKDKKTINGTMAGESFQVTYTPSKDINGEYTCDVTYGFAAGQTPQAAIVTLLQLRGDDIIDRDTFRENLPFDLDMDGVQRRLDVQKLRDSLMGGVMGVAGATGAMVQQGMDPTPILNALAALVKAREDGKSVESVLPDLFAPPPPEPAAVDPMADPMAGGGGPGGPTVGQGGEAPGVAPGQAGLPAGGLPTVQNLVAGFRGDTPQMDSSVRRRIATGGK